MNFDNEIYKYLQRTITKKALNYWGFTVCFILDIRHIIPAGSYAKPGHQLAWWYLIEPIMRRIMALFDAYLR